MQTLKQKIEAANAGHAAMVLAKVLVNVEKGMPLDVAYDLVFGAGAYMKLASDIHDAANAR
jgi:hypothetical protein